MGLWSLSKERGDRKTGHKDGTKMTQTLNLHLNRNKKDTIVKLLLGDETQETIIVPSIYSTPDISGSTYIQVQFHRILNFENPRKWDLTVFHTMLVMKNDCKQNNLSK